jgi:hypothetical protein
MTLFRLPVNKKNIKPLLKSISAAILELIITKADRTVAMNVEIGNRIYFLRLIFMLVSVSLNPFLRCTTKIFLQRFNCDHQNKRSKNHT